MLRSHSVPGFAFSCLIASAAPALAQHGHGAAADDTIKSAMSAAPETVAKEATVVTVSPDGRFQVVRQGSNNFTCMPDNPQTPGPDPMCGDANAMEWIQAWASRKEPPEDKIGFIFMLAGGTDASNTDPYAEKPEANNNWIETGPHVMIVGARKLLSQYPRDARPDTTQPYVMWPGTPYEHLMIPVK